MSNDLSPDPNPDGVYVNEDESDVGPHDRTSVAPETPEGQKLAPDAEDGAERETAGDESSGDESGGDEQTTNLDSIDLLPSPDNHP